jgi:hypothetical protein
VVALVGIGRQILDKAVDLVDQPLAACIERRCIERWIAINALKAVFGEDCAKGGWDRNAALGVDLIGECRDKLVHLPLMGTWANAGLRHAPGASALLGELGGRGGAVPPWPQKERCRASPTRHRTGKHGIAWDIMGGQGISWEKT